MRSVKAYKISARIVSTLPLLFTHPVFADTTNSVAGVSNVETFISSVTKVVVIVTGAVAITMFAIGGFSYVTSSGNPERLERAKHTLLYAAIGSAISIASAVLGGIVTALATNAFGS